LPEPLDQCLLVGLLSLAGLCSKVHEKSSTGKETSDATIFPRNLPPANQLLKPLAIDRIIEIVRTDRKAQKWSGLHKAFTEALEHLFFDVSEVSELTLLRIGSVHVARPINLLRPNRARSPLFAFSKSRLAAKLLNSEEKRKHLEELGAIGRENFNQDDRWTGRELRCPQAGRT
jgi:hypothetical protein